jgi:type IV pilus assembly protein PilW
MNGNPDMAGAGRPPAAAGTTLIELMVALLLGALLISASVTAYLEARDLRAALDASARLQEIARYAMSAIEADIRMAGYWGLTNRADLVTANASLAFPAKCGGTAWITDTRRYIDGTNNSYLLAGGCAALSGGPRAGADVLLVRRASAQRIAPQKPVVASPDQDRVLVITSHTAGQIFVPSDIGNAIPPGYASADLAGVPPQADTRALLVNAYYVSAGSSVAPDYPALRRKTLTAGPDVGDEEVIAGVEDLQFQVGVDTNGDSNADQFVDPGLIPDGASPVSVRIWLRLRARERDGGLTNQLIAAYADRPVSVATDGHLRLLVSTTVQIRNARW